MRAFLDRMGGRKWTLVLGTWCVGTAFTLGGVVSGGQWVDLTLGLVFAYSVGNAATHAAHRRKGSDQVDFDALGLGEGQEASR
jgi:hypothetical protein